MPYRVILVTHLRYHYNVQSALILSSGDIMDSESQQLLWWVIFWFSTAKFQ